MCRDFIQDKGKNLYCSPECKRSANNLSRIRANRKRNEKAR